MLKLEKEKIETIEKLVSIGRLGSPEIKKAIMSVERELFVLPDYKKDAWVDAALPIVGKATISAPHMYAIMFEEAKLKKGEKVLEVGSGSGYGAALIRELVGKEGKVITMEIEPEVYDFAKKNLKKAGYTDVKIVLSDGSIGYEKEAPYDCIIVTATAPEIPRVLIKQLRPGGRMLAPVGGAYINQKLIYVKKNEDGSLEERDVCDVIFVPLKGKFGYNV